MAFVPLPNGVKVVLNQVWNGQIVANVMHATTTETIDSNKLIEIADCFADFWIAISPMLHTSIQLTSVVATDVSVENGAQEIFVTGLPATGGDNTSASLTNNAAFVATLRSGLTGRSNRGRMYIAGMPMGALVSANTLAPTYVANILAELVNLLDCLSAGSNQLVIASYQRNGVVLSTGVAVPVTGFSMDPTTDSQRRRLPGRGQ